MPDEWPTPSGGKPPITAIGAAMKPKHRRLVGIGAALFAMGLGVAVILYAFNDSLVFFYTPGQLAEKRGEAGFDSRRALRIGGLVKNGSVENYAPNHLRFTVTDFTSELVVEYEGLVPSLFREGQGVVAQGTLLPDGQLKATQILAKHDENYMPREVREALKQSGRWRDGEAYPGTMP